MYIWSLIRAAICLILGVALVIVSLTDRLVPESKLKMFEGVPKQVRVYKASRHYKIEFYLGDLRTDYTDENPQYLQVIESVKSSKPIKVWVDADSFKDSYRLYKMSVGDKPVITYAETVDANKKSNTYQLGIGLILGLLGGYLLFKRLKG
jgi:hypothetical protein